MRIAERAHLAVHLVVQRGAADAVLFDRDLDLASWTNDALARRLDERHALWTAALGANHDLPFGADAIDGDAPRELDLSASAHRVGCPRKVGPEEPYVVASDVGELHEHFNAPVPLAIGARGDATRLSLELGAERHGLLLGALGRRAVEAEAKLGEALEAIKRLGDDGQAIGIAHREFERLAEEVGRGSVVGAHDDRPEMVHVEAGVVKDGGGCSARTRQAAPTT